MTRYLTPEEVLFINSQIHGGQAQIRDYGLLESALARPQASAFGEDAYLTIFEKAAALLQSIALNHPFVDGNKRTATIALTIFLELNGLQVTWQPDEALGFILGVAQHQYELPEMVVWLEQNTQS